MGQSTTVIPTGGGGAKVQDSIPTNPQKGDLWVDTSTDSPISKFYNGVSFQRLPLGDSSIAESTVISTDTYSLSNLFSPGSNVISGPTGISFSNLQGALTSKAKIIEVEVFTDVNSDFALGTNTSYNGLTIDTDLPVPISTSPTTLEMSGTFTSDVSLTLDVVNNTSSSERVEVSLQAKFIGIEEHIHRYD